MFVTHPAAPCVCAHTTVRMPHNTPQGPNGSMGQHGTTEEHPEITRQRNLTLNDLAVRDVMRLPS